MNRASRVFPGMDGGCPLRVVVNEDGRGKRVKRRRARFRWQARPVGGSEECRSRRLARHLNAIRMIDKPSQRTRRYRNAKFAQPYRDSFLQSESFATQRESPGANHLITDQ